MRSPFPLFVSVAFALVALAAIRRSGPAAPQPAFHRARRAASDYPNPLIARRQVKADSLRAPQRAKRACPSGLPSCECNPACSADQVCQFGTCVSTCDTSTGEYEDCNGICINVLSDDNNNCGACGFTCPPNRPICDGGVCACDTANGYVDCETICTPVSDFQTDPYNCGGCQVMPYCIGTGQVCKGGSCICDASNGYELCDETCTPISDYQDDFYNCGACGIVCPPDSMCQTGTCICDATGFTICDGTCVDTTSDSTYCGTCSTVCYNDMVCVTSACVCPSGYMDCDGNCIYVDDNENCGTCGAICDVTGATCTNGQCLCIDSGYENCNGICEAVSTDSSNCGTCGTVCGSDSAGCSGGECVPCQTGYTTCNAPCDTYISSDFHNCGRCGNVCQSGQECVYGECTCNESQVVCQDGTCGALGSCTSIAFIAAYSGTEFVGYITLDGTLSLSPDEAGVAYAIVGEGPQILVAVTSSEFSLLSASNDWTDSPNNAYALITTGIYEQLAPGYSAQPYGDDWFENAIWSVGAVATPSGYALTAQWIDVGGEVYPLTFFWFPISPLGDDDNAIYASNNPGFFEEQGTPWSPITLFYQIAN